MKVADAKDNYYYQSGKASDIARQLCLAGIAVVWIFRTDISGSPHVPAELMPVAAWLVVALALDFIQYVTASAIWGIYHRCSEMTHNEDEEFTAPPIINWPALFFFWAKFLATIYAYVRLLEFLFAKLH